MSTITYFPSGSVSFPTKMFEHDALAAALSVPSASMLP
jgi:hypothetical protein